MFLLCLWSEWSRAGHAQVAVASNFIPTMRALVKDFEANSTHTIGVSFGSSGKLYAQIIHGAPFDVFFSADQIKPLQLIANTKLTEGEGIIYATGRLVLWSASADLFSDKMPRAHSVEISTFNNSEYPKSALQDNEQNIHDYQKRLKGFKFSRLAIANPRLAPYGQASVEVLDSLEITAQTRSNWIMAENISQTFQFVRSGNVDLGFIALSQLILNPSGLNGSYWLLPEHLHGPILQMAVMLKRGAANPAAQAFLRFIQTEEARTIIREYGYSTSSSALK